MKLQATDNTLRTAIRAMADTTDKIVPGAGDSYRKFADETYPIDEDFTKARSATFIGTGEAALKFAAIEATIDEAELRQAMRDTKHLDDVMQER